MAVRDNALTTLQKTKDYLGISGSSDDTLLERFIDAAAGMTEAITRRKLKYDETGGITEGVYTPATTPVKCLLNGTDTPNIWLPEFPVQSISLVRTRDTEVASWVTIDSDDYNIYHDTGQIALASAILPVTGVWPKGSQTVEFTYKAGYDFANDEMPMNIELFQWAYVSYFFKGRKRDPSVKSESLSGVYAYTKGPLDPKWGIPRDMVVLLEPYRKIMVR